MVVSFLLWWMIVDCPFNHRLAGNLSAGHLAARQILRLANLLQFASCHELTGNSAGFPDERILVACESVH
jgi:hypothetical protein